MSEDELLARVIDEARRYGALAFHSTDSRRDTGTGFPDVVVAGKHGLIFRELKSDFGTLLGSQVSWKYHLLGAGQDWDIWRPADWQSGRISEEIEAVA